MPRPADLIETLVGSNGQERKRARETLSLSGEAAVGRLRPLLSSQDKLTRWEAAKCLAVMVEPSCVGDFVELLEDEHSDVRWIAGSGLIALGPRSVSPLLESLVRRPDSLGYRQAARRILRALSSENDVLAEIVGPVIDVLDYSDPAVVAARAAGAEEALERVRLPT